MELLSDPVKDRQVKSVRPPPHKPLNIQTVFPEKLKIDFQEKPDWKLLKQHLSAEGRIDKESLLALIQQANQLFRNEGNLLYIQDPVTVVGDIHGQFYDLLKILEVGGNPENTKYLFLGDFVDRGSFSIEVLILLYSIKICFPSTITFIRGNHECRQMTSFFNFRDECLYKYDQEIYDTLMDSFDLIPITCILNKKFLATHGGISPELRTIDDLKKIDRFQEPQKSGLLCDLLWADPVDNDDGACDQTFKNNEVRGCSYFFGYDAVSKFLKNNSLLMIIRGHEAQIEGYKMYKWKGKNEFPSVITIFSAPNYCDVYNNKGAVIKFEQNTLNIQQFNYSPHPYLLPNFMDIFTWSIPFVAEKVGDIIQNLIAKGEDEDNLDDAEEEKYEQLMRQKEQEPAKTEGVLKQSKISEMHYILIGGALLKKKLKFISKMALYQKTLRENHEQIVKLKGLCPDNKIPQGLLTEGSFGIKNEQFLVLDKFSNAKTQDKVNEKRPEFIPQKKKK